MVNNKNSTTVYYGTGGTQLLQTVRIDEDTGAHVTGLKSGKTLKMLGDFVDDTKAALGRSAPSRKKTMANGHAELMTEIAMRELERITRIIARP